MKSNKQRRTELKVKKAIKAVARIIKAEQGRLAALSGELALSGGAEVDASQLAPDGSYGKPPFAERGYYLDQPFICQGCDEPQIWTAAQQKWWYEVAKGGVWTTATRCRPCRLRERTRREEARRIHSEGIARKQSDM